MSREVQANSSGVLGVSQQEFPSLLIYQAIAKSHVFSGSNGQLDCQTAYLHADIEFEFELAYIDALDSLRSELQPLALGFLAANKTPCGLETSKHSSSD